MTHFSQRVLGGLRPVLERLVPELEVLAGLLQARLLGERGGGRGGGGGAAGRARARRTAHGLRPDHALLPQPQGITAPATPRPASRLVLLSRLHRAPPCAGADLAPISMFDVFSYEWSLNFDAFFRLMFYT